MTVQNGIVAPLHQDGEKRQLRSAEKELRATTIPVSFAAKVMGLQPLNLDEKMHAAADKPEAEQPAAEQLVLSCPNKLPSCLPEATP